MPNLGVARLTVSLKDNRSVVTQQFGQSPLQIHRPLYLEAADYPVVYLRTPSSGLLDGDTHEINVKVEADATMELRTQAATLVYPGSSILNIAVDVGPGASFIFHPHPIILAAGADFKQDVRIGLAENARLDYQESWCAGRIAMSEQWRFTRFDNALSITAGGALKYREHWRIEPASYAMTHPVLCGDYTHFCSRFLFGIDRSAPESSPGSRCWVMKRDGDTIIRIASCR